MKLNREALVYDLKTESIILQSSLLALKLPGGEVTLAFTRPSSLSKLNPTTEIVESGRK